MNNIKESLEWRYATKKFDSSRKINNETLDVILETLRLSPSSYGLQPWKFIVVNNPEIREKIKEASYGQSQVTEASHLIVFTNKKDINAELVDEYIKFLSVESHVDISKLEGLSNMVKGNFQTKTIEELRSWASRQVYLAMGVMLAGCATLSIDTCPMEGFDNKKIDEILNLSDLGLESRAMVALGYRSTEDVYALRPKIRFPKKDVFLEIN